MSESIAATVAARVRDGKVKLGQVIITPRGNGFELRHEEDVQRKNLQQFEGAERARFIALYDDSGKYRPLKTAPNLARGWSLQLADEMDLLGALNFIYPAQCGMWKHLNEGELSTVDLRETLSRQTGMYRITRLLSNDQAQTVIADTCNSEKGCLRKILWRIDPNEPVRSLPPEKFDVDACAPNETPLVCAEACNLLVAAARPVAKKNLPAKP